MKKIVLIIGGIFWGFGAMAQNSDTVKNDSTTKVLLPDSLKNQADTVIVPVVKLTPIATDKYELAMQGSPVPTFITPIKVVPVVLKPYIIDSKINYWRTKTSIGVNLNQSSFSSNWKGGGVNSVALGGLINYKAEYNKGSFDFAHETNLQYGKLRNRGQLDKKSVDRIFVDNKLGLQLSKSWFFFSALTFESQFDAGYSYSTSNGVEVASLISKFMAPGYVTESLGFEYKPVKYFNVRLGTLTARQTFVLDTTLHNNNAANFGVPIGKTMKNEMACQITANFEKDIAKNINFKWRYLVFFPYQNLTFNTVKHRLDATLTAKINNYINVNLGGVVLFDKDIDPKVQTSQALSVGVMVILPR